MKPKNVLPGEKENEIEELNPIFSAALLHLGPRSLLTCAHAFLHVQGSPQRAMCACMSYH